MSFTDRARRLAGQAGLLLGWRPEDFWRATPDELADALGPLLGGAQGEAMDRASLERMMEEQGDG